MQGAVNIIVLGLAVLFGLLLYSMFRRGSRGVTIGGGSEAERLLSLMTQPAVGEVTRGFPKFRGRPGQTEIVVEREGMTVFDYRIVHDPGGTSQRIGRIPCVVGTLGARGPQLTITRHAALDPSGSDLALPRVGFESALFNDEIEVRCADERFAHTLIDQRMMEWLLLLPPGSGLEVVDDRVLAYGREGSRAMQSGPVIELLESFLEHVPAVLASLYPAE